MQATCFHCMQPTVCWDSDFDYQDYCFEGEGIVHVCHCSNCGAEILYMIRTDDPEKDCDEDESVGN